MNAGIRLWEAQKEACTGLCIGIDPHVNEHLVGVYKSYAHENDWLGVFQRQVDRHPFPGSIVSNTEAPVFFAGVTNYFLRVIDIAWEEGLRVFKPQGSFFERFDPFGMIILSILCHRINELGAASGKFFKIADVKRGDISTTQRAYYDKFLTRFDEPLIPGIMSGQYEFNTMTIHTWMGTDVLNAGLEHFKSGRGAIVVNISSNDSWSEFQNLFVSANSDSSLNDKQKKFHITQGTLDLIQSITGHDPTVAHVMMFLSDKFSKENDLDEELVSPIFNVVGSTVKVDDSLRKLRPNGIFLNPGWGAQGGKWENVEPLVVKRGPLEGHIAILAASRSIIYPWMRGYGGDDDHKRLEHYQRKGIRNFRKMEKQAYRKFGVDFPF
jgi:orotidine 5'-phosphate decarboxylase subfamily 2